MQPSTAWKEQIAADEAARFEGYARQFVELQRRKSQKYGKGRALHRKQLLAVKASFEVLPGLPEAARHGLFAQPGIHEAWVRLSNGGADRAPDRKPDIRGFALKVFGVAGPGALGSNQATSQDFLLINHSAFAFAKSDEFVGLAIAASAGAGTLLKYLLGRYGLIGGLRLVARFVGTLGKAFKGYASESFYSAAPIACGPYAARVRLVPAPPQSEARTQDWADELRQRLPLSYDFQLQFFVDEAATPIEDASVDWPETIAPYVSVARLSLPQQDFTDAAAGQFAEDVEAAVFDPWSGLMAHRPLGDVMRARKVVYFASERERGAV